MSGSAAGLARLAGRIDALTLRERGILFLAAVAVLSVIVLQWLLAPVNARERQLRTEVEQRLAKTLALQTRFEILGQQFAEDPNAPRRRRLQEIDSELAQLRGSLGELTRGLVSPVEMASLVQQVLQRNRGLEVIEVASLTDVPLLSRSADAAAKATAEPPAEPAAAPLHKHGLRLRLRGSYRDIVAYLRDLEALPWKVFWGRVELATVAWPRSDVTIVIYTLSRDAAWIGTG